TGGLAVGAISTKSRFASLAFWSASAIRTIPSASPASPIKRTSFQRICSLTRMLFLSIRHLHGFQFLPSLRDRLLSKREKFFHGESPGVAAVAQAHRNGSRGRLLLADDQHRRRLLQLGLPDAGAELLVLLVGLDAQAGGLELLGDRLRRPVEALGDGK